MALVHYDGEFKAYLPGLTRIPLFRLNEITFTTIGNIDNLDFSNVSLIRMDNASDAIIRGLLAGVPGQIVSIASIGAGHVYLEHENANSSAVNRLTNAVTSGVTPLKAGKGTCIYQYDGTTERWRLISHTQGGQINISYNSALFTASGAMTWTVDSGDVTTLKYELKGTTIQLSVDLRTTTIGGVASTNLRITFPNGYITSSQMAGPTAYIDGGAPAQTGLWITNNTSSFIQLWKSLSGGNWTLGANNTTIVFVSFIEVA